MYPYIQLFILPGIIWQINRKAAFFFLPDNTSVNQFDDFPL